MECRCDTVTELYGTQAEEYVAGHLRRDETRTEEMRELYACPDTGRRWELDWPQASEQDPGQARLRMLG